MILTHLPIWAEDAEIHGVVITAMGVTSLSAAMHGKGGEVGMRDMEKVINVLSKYKKHAFGYNDEKVTVEEIIAMLKAQEPVEPVRRRRHGQIGYSCFCGMCGYGIGRNEKYCALCGKAAKWE